MSDDRPTQPYAASAAVAAPPPVPPQGQAPVRDRTGLAIAMMCAVSLIFAVALAPTPTAVTAFTRTV